MNSFQQFEALSAKLAAKALAFVEHLKPGESSPDDVTTATKLVQAAALLQKVRLYQWELAHSGRRFVAAEQKQLGSGEEL